MNVQAGFYRTPEGEFYPMPDEHDLPVELRARFRMRAHALKLVIEGATIDDAARLTGVSKRSISQLVRRAKSVSPSGHPHGFNACVPYRVRVPGKSKTKSKVAHRIGTTGSFSRLIDSCPEVKEVIASAPGLVPNERKKPVWFGALHRRLLNAVRKNLGEGAYPLQTKDQGRRALARWLNANLSSHTPSSFSPEESIARPMTLGEAISPGFFERVELDAHKLDFPFYVEVIGDNGVASAIKATCLTIVVAVDSKSRCVLSFVLIVGPAADHRDVLSCMSRCIEPWEPRVFDYINFELPPWAGYPAQRGRSGARLRPLVFALDNALAHHADDLQSVACRKMRVALSHGPAHVPEVRGIVEAFFRKFENSVIRRLPGGFIPSHALGEEPTQVTPNSSKHPTPIPALEELLEAVIAIYNGSEHPSLGTQSPLKVIDGWLRSGEWSNSHFDNESTAEEMGHLVLSVRVGGSKTSGVAPHITYQYVRYRSHDLSGRWDLVGQSVHIRVNTRDLRKIAVMRTNGEVIALLSAASPWAEAKHDLRLRRRIMQWARKAGVKLHGTECAVSAYITAVAEQAKSGSKFAAERFAHAASVSGVTQKRPLQSTRAIPSKSKEPRSGWIAIGEND